MFRKSKKRSRPLSRAEYFQKAAQLLRWNYIDKPVNFPPRTLLKLDAFLPRSSDNLYQVTNLLDGKIEQKNTSIFDYQTITIPSKNPYLRTYSPITTFLLLDIFPEQLPIISFREPDWADTWLLKQNYITGIQAKHVFIQSAYTAELQQVFTPSVLAYYESRPHIRIRTNGRYLLLHQSPERAARVSKQIFLDFIAEAKYFYRLISALE